MNKYFSKKRKFCFAEAEGKVTESREPNIFRHVYKVISNKRETTMITANTVVIGVSYTKMLVFFAKSIFQTQKLYQINISGQNLHQINISGPKYLFYLSKTNLLKEHH